MGLTDRIRKLAADKGHTFASLERELSLGQGTIRKWDKNSPSCDKLLQVANFLSVTTDFLLTGQDTKFEIRSALPRSDDELQIGRWWGQLDEVSQAIIKGDILRRLETKKTDYTEINPLQNTLTAKMCTDFDPSSKRQPKRIMIPLVGRAAAGIPIEMIETVGDGLLADARPGDFAVVADGDSMVDVGINNGDRCLIRQQSAVDDGQIALVAVDGGSTIKRFYREADHVKLMPANPAHRTQLYDSTHDIRILGRFIRVIND